MKKRLLSMMLALVLTASAVFTGCGMDPKALLESLASQAESAIQEGMDAVGGAVDEIEETLEEAIEEISGEGAEDEEESAEAQTAESERVTLSHGDSWKETEAAEETEAPADEAASETEAPAEEEPEAEEAPQDEENVPDEAEKAAFMEFTNGLIADFFEGDTFNAHYYFMDPDAFGISTDEPMLPRFSYDEESDTSYEDFLNESLEALAGFDYDKLDRAGQITYDVVKDFLETELTSVDFDFYYEPLCGVSGYQSSLPVFFAEYKFFSADDVDDYLVYLQQMPEHFEDLLLYEQQKADAGMFMEDTLAQEVIEQIDSFLETEDDENNFLYESFEARLNELELTEEQKQDYIAKNREYAPLFYDAYRTLRDGMEALLGSSQYAVGLCNFPDGDAYYEYLIKTNVGTSMTPEELVDYLEEKENEYFNELLMIYNSVPNVQGKMSHFTYPSEDPEEIMPMLIEEASKNFPELPEVQYEIKYVDESLREYLNPAFYIIPPFGEGSTNEIYINPDEDGSVPEDIWTTMAHEGYPGHLYQYNFWKNINEYAIRGIMDPTGYAEGWADYVEHRSYYFEGADEDTADFIRANDLTTMAIYGLMDLGIHYQGWSYDQFASYVTQNFGALEDDVISDVYYYIAGNPAEYLQYAVGEFEFLDIIDDCTEEGGVDMKEFYREYLTIGPAPFDIIRKYLGLD